MTVEDDVLTALRTLQPTDAVQIAEHLGADVTQVQETIDRLIKLGKVVQSPTTGAERAAEVGDDPAPPDMRPVYAPAPD